NTLYVCFVEPNVLVRRSNGETSAKDFRGYHGAFYGPGGAPVCYAVIPYPGGVTNNAGTWYLSNLDSMTMTASHEIAQPATDPVVNFSPLGWYDNTWLNPDGSRGGEVGDITVDRVMYIGGFAMQRIANKDDFPMTPAQATSNRPVNFVLQSNGNLYEVAGG